jgi:hypothetical protein
MLLDIILDYFHNGRGGYLRCIFRCYFIIVEIANLDTNLDVCFLVVRRTIYIITIVVKFTN